MKLFKDNIFGHFLQCRSYPSSGVTVHNILLRQVSHRLLNKYFGGRNHDLNLGQFEKRFMNLDFKTIDDTDALRIAMFYFADRVLHGRNDHCQINFNLLNEVDDINHFRSIPWGRLSWETIYKSIDNALNDKANIFKRAIAENPLLRI